MSEKGPEQLKLEAWYAEQKRNGLVDIKLTIDPRPGMTVEELCRSLNECNDAIAAGKGRSMTAADFGEEEVPEKLLELPKI
jgi:hypothetical protein